MKYLWIFWFLCSGAAFAQEDFDFALIANECDITVAYAKLSDDSVKTVPGDKPIFLCKRASKNLSCNLSYENSKKEETRKYIVNMDSPPMLMINSENNAELFLINTNELSAAYTSRMIDSNYIGTKVCNMAFFTGDQYKAFTKESKK